MIRKIGTGDTTGEPVVLAELNEHEKAALSRILHLAEAHLDEIKAPQVGRRREMAAVMIGDLRSVFGIPAGAERTSRQEG